MNKGKYVVIILIFLIIIPSVLAFSFSDVTDFVKNIFGTKENYYEVNISSKQNRESISNIVPTCPEGFSGIKKEYKIPEPIFKKLFKECYDPRESELLEIEKKENKFKRLKIHDPKDKTPSSMGKDSKIKIQIKGKSVVRIKASKNVKPLSKEELDKMMKKIVNSPKYKNDPKSWVNLSTDINNNLKNDPLFPYIKKFKNYIEDLKIKYK